MSIAITSSKATKHQAQVEARQNNFSLSYRLAELTVFRFILSYTISHSAKAVYHYLVLMNYIISWPALYSSPTRKTTAHFYDEKQLDSTLVAAFLFLWGLRKVKRPKIIILTVPFLSLSRAQASVPVCSWTSKGSSHPSLMILIKLLPTFQIPIIKVFIFDKTVDILVCKTRRTLRLTYWML